MKYTLEQIKKGKNKKLSFSNIKLNKKEREEIYGQYAQNLIDWHQYTKEFVNSPIVTDEHILDMKKLSSGQKSLIVRKKWLVDSFYQKACLDMYKKYHFEKINCASYAGFVSTFLKLLNPENDIVVYFGVVIVTKSPKKEEINKYADHFWVTVNGKLFDNSKVDGYSYTNYEAILKTKDIISGNFNFE